jgi:hypothetical protein
MAEPHSAEDVTDSPGFDASLADAKPSDASPDAEQGPGDDTVAGE